MFVFIIKTMRDISDLSRLPDFLPSKFPYGLYSLFGFAINKSDNTSFCWNEWFIFTFIAYFGKEIL